MALVAPKEVQIKCQDGKEKTFILSKIPAIPAREIVTQYPISALPKVGEYKVNEEIMLKLMSYVAVPVENGSLQLTTRALVDNHIPDWEALAKLEIAMLDYNISFFGTGEASTFFGAIAQKVPQYATKILTDLLAQLSQKGALPSNNSGPSTA